MAAVSEQEVFEVVARMVRNFEGREYSLEITPETRFFADLGFASIDAIVLAEHLEKHFERELPFAAFLSELAQSGAQDLQVGQLVRFLYAALK